MRAPLIGPAGACRTPGVVSNRAGWGKEVDSQRGDGNRKGGVDFRGTLQGAGEDPEKSAQCCCCCCCCNDSEDGFVFHLAFPRSLPLTIIYTTETSDLYSDLSCEQGGIFSF